MHLIQISRFLATAMTTSSIAFLYLAPSHNPIDKRTLPIALGRKSLLSWWWRACPCSGIATRKPCVDCKLLGNHARALSRIMFHVNSVGSLALDSLCMNRTLVQVNGIGVLGRAQQLWDGDVITIGKSSSLAWMTLHVRTKRVVTPEAKRFLPMKSIRRLRDSGAEFALGNEMLSAKERHPVESIAECGLKFRCWLKKKSRKKEYEQTNETCRSAELNKGLISHKVSSVRPNRLRTCPSKPAEDSLYSKVDGFGKESSASRESISIPRERDVNKRIRMRIDLAVKTQELDQNVSSHLVKSRGDEGLTSDPDDEGPLRPSSVVRYNENEGLQFHTSVREHANSVSPIKVWPETQASGPRLDSPQPPSQDDKVLSLPQCPTYDGDSCSSTDKDEDCVG